MRLIVNPLSHQPNTWGAIEPPLVALQIASESDCAILDAEAQGLSIEQTVAEIERFNPDTVLFVAMGRNPAATSTPKIPIIADIASRLNGKFRLEITGIHPLALPELTHQETGCEVKKLDVAIDAPLNWDLLPMHLYRAHNWHCLDGSPRSPYGLTFTSMGCPHDCYFCPIHALYQTRQVQFRPVNSVLRDMAVLVGKYGVRNIKFWDELSTLNEIHLTQVCQAIISEDFSLNALAYAHTNTVSPPMLRLMKKAGINWLAYGFETAKEGFGKNKQAKEAILATRDAGINIIGNFLFGLPGETKEDWQRTLEFAQENLFEYVNFNVALPYPGSPWFKENNAIKEWQSYNQFNLVGTPAKQFRDDAFQQYFRSREYLNHIAKKFGNQAVNHINDLLASPPPQVKVTRE